MFIQIPHQSRVVPVSNLAPDLFQPQVRAYETSTVDRLLSSFSILGPKAALFAQDQENRRSCLVEAEMDPDLFVVHFNAMFSEKG